MPLVLFGYAVYNSNKTELLHADFGFDSEEEAYYWAEEYSNYHNIQSPCIEVRAEYRDEGYGETEYL